MFFMIGKTLGHCELTAPVPPDLADAGLRIVEQRSFETAVDRMRRHHQCMPDQTLSAGKGGSP
jgi:hypothetical protein